MAKRPVLGKNGGRTIVGRAEDGIIALGLPEVRASEVSTMFRRFAVIAALLAFVGIVPGHGIAAPAATSPAAMIVADCLPPLLDPESGAGSALPKRTLS